MGYERYPRGNDPQRDDRPRDDGLDDRDTYSRARDYRAAGWSGAGAGDGGAREDGRTEEQRRYGAPRGGGFGGGDRDYYRGDRQQQQQGFAGQGYGDRDYARDPYRQARGTFDRQPQGHDDDRGFVQRAGDEVRSWFGDEEAERRREADAHRDEHYRSWRDQQVAAFDRDYDEYRREHQSKFHNEFSSWRTGRQGQRDLLGKVEEHAEVVGSDGEHVGTVDKVRGDRIVLTKDDADAGGRHHSVPSNWLEAADAGKVTLRKTAAEAQAAWRDEERSGALFGEGDARDEQQPGRARAYLDRSFSGTN